MLEDNILQTHVDASCSVLLFQNDVLLSLKIEYSNKLSDEHTIVNYGKECTSNDQEDTVINFEVTNYFRTSGRYRLVS